MVRSKQVIIASLALVAAASLVAGPALVTAGSPSPAAGPGPAVPQPPPSELPVPRGPLLPRPSIDPLDQPSGAGAGVTPPAEIVGSWYAGSVSDIGYVDPNNGSYSEGGSDGQSYTFLPDGSWSYGWLLTSQLYACAMKVLVYRDGVLVASDPIARLLILDARLAQMHSEDTCSAEENYDKDLPPDDDTLFWRRTTDEYGEVLMLRSVATEWSVFRPMGD